MTFLPEDLLATIHGRAAEVDATNTFPDADLADLRDAGYLAAFVPAEFGGGGLTLEQVCAEQTRLAQASPATALGMTTVWVDNGSEHGNHDNEPGHIDYRITDVADWLHDILEDR